MTERPPFFGTDGIRGRVGEGVMTADFLVKLGWAVGYELALAGASRVVIGKDTRSSGYMIESALEAGLSAAGMETLLLGPMPTPGIAYLTQALRADLGIVISASHNPYEDNGVKFFTSDGFKITKQMEETITARLHEPMITVSAKKIGRARRLADVTGRYIELCKRSIPHRTHFKNLKIIVDCANGATYRVAPPIFTELGADVTPIHTTPDGYNINADCGSNNPDELRKHVLAGKADLGVAFDGDGDRLIMVDHLGEILDGDELLYIITKGLIGTPLFSGGVIGTIMSNKGLEIAIGDLGLAFVRVGVGDQNIIDELLKRKWMLGGEPSGHITYLYENTTADGIIAALQVLQYITAKGITLHEARQGIKIFPKKLTNIPIKNRDLNLEEGEIGKAINDAKDKLGERGRILARYSGTEPLLRIFVEGEDDSQVDKISRELCEEIEEKIK